MKITKEHQKKGQDIHQSLIAEAWRNTTFKEQLISSPSETIENYLGEGFKIPEDCRVVVEDQSNPDNIYVNIPRKMDFEDVELSEEQLEAVSGGLAWIPVVIALAVIAYNGYKDAQE